MIESKLNEFHIGYLLNIYHIYNPRLVSQLISEFEEDYKVGQNLILAIEEFLFKKITHDMKNNFSKIKYSYLKKRDLFEIIYSYNLSMDAILGREPTEFQALLTYLQIHQNTPRFNLAQKKQMKRKEISFTPSLQKINKSYLGLSFLLWFMIYTVIFYYKFI